MILKYCFAFLKHGSLWTYRVATWAVLIAGAAFILLVLGLRYAVLPHIDAYRGPIEQAISRAAGQPVRIGSISGSWQGYRPELHFQDVRLIDGAGNPALALDRVDAVFAWVSLLSGDVRFHSLEIHGLRLEVRRDAQGVVYAAGLAVGEQDADGGFGNWLLAQRQILVRGAEISWTDELRGAPELVMGKVEFRLDNWGATHEFGLTAEPPAAVASGLTVRGVLEGSDTNRLSSWTGRLYAEVGRVDLPLADAWVAAPVELSSGVGSLKLWLDLAGGRVTSATAELGLSGVNGKLGADLPELGLSRLTGRFGWTDDGLRRELSATSLAFTTDAGLQLAPMRFSFVRTAAAGDAPSHSELVVEALDLAPVTQLAGFLPLDATLRERLARLQPSGMVARGRVAWDGDFDRSRPWSAAAAFSNLAVRADGALPGVRGLNGQIEATDKGGTATVDVNGGSLDLPRVFGEPVPIDVLTAGAGWAMRDGQLYLTLRNASFTNEHAAGSVQGTYHTDPDGPGTIDLTGVLVRADARQVWRYLPVAFPVTRDWLRSALQAGESRDVRLRLKGKLRDFPFENDRNGLFEIVARASNVTIAYANGWPPLTGVFGDLVFRGRRMEVRPQAASVLGVNLSEVSVLIPDLGLHDEHLKVKGFADAPTERFLDFVAQSPVGSHIDNVNQRVKASGDARLSLDLDLTLHRMADSRAAGEIVLRDNRVQVDPRMPEFEKFGARIAFARGTGGRKGSFSIREGRAQVLGSPLTFETLDQSDGALALKLGGTIEAERMAALSNLPALHFLEGRLAWTGLLSLRNKVATVRFDSDLEGLGSRLPAPLAKSAQAKQPLRIELRERGGHQGLLTVSLDKTLGAQLELDSLDIDGVRRGVVNLGTGNPAATPMPTTEGTWIRGRLERVDVDAWQAVLGEGDGGAGAGAKAPKPDLAGLDLQIANLGLARRQFHDLDIDVSIRGGLWQGTLAGQEVAGKVSWSDEGQGRLTANLSRLVLPVPASVLEPARAPAPDRSLPSLDIDAESFNFEGKELGRLSVRADPDRNGWKLENLEIDNPDAHLTLTGHWNTTATPRVDVAVKLQVSDIGRFFTRVGWPEGVKGGTASIEGPVNWIGNPTRLDIPSLSGKLRLEAHNGRFQQINPGAAKLLGILSLQALPKRLSLDFDDVFRKGFTFDSIKATLDIASGVAHTEDFRMEGSSAAVGMRGTVDLAAETQNLVLRVVPSLTGSVAVAGALVNPAIGIAALIAQMALKDPLGQFAAFEYTITGKWAEPVVTRVSHSSEGSLNKGR